MQGWAEVEVKGPISDSPYVVQKFLYIPSCSGGLTIRSYSTP